MGIRLIVEVLDHAPAELTAQERLVLVVLAEDAPERTRTCWPGRAKLTRRTGLDASNVSRALDRLASRGYVVRVPLGTDKNGKPVYAYRGRATTYRVPEFAPAADSERDASTHAFTDEKGLRSGEKGLRSEAERVADVASPPLSTPHVSSQDRARERNQPPWERDDVLSAVIDEIKRLTGKTVSDDHARREAKRLLDGRTVSDPCAYVKGALRKAAEEGRLADHLPGYQPPRYRAPDRSHLPEAWR